jgi:glycosyltransferase involved in cell wall biosynthesis
MNKPLLTIITINYNNVDGLEKTMNSVFNQTYVEYEYIVIDGGSTDGSYEVLQNYDEKINYWISEKDKGIYNAMNKGIETSSGRYLLFLNSGDFLINDEVLEKASKELFNDFDFISGNLEYLTENGNLYIRKHPEKLTFSYLVSKTVSHPSTFIKREIFTQYGLYNETLKIVSDWEFFFKALGLNGATFKSIDITITHFDMSGISSIELDLVNQEKELVFKKYLPTIYNSDFDTYLFQKFFQPNKRIKLLMSLDKKPLVRRIVTIVLQLVNKF